MANFFLNITPDQINDAIKCGAQYHEFCKRWYINIEKLSNINPEWDKFMANTYAKYFYLAKTLTTCPNCKEKTTVYSVILDECYSLDMSLQVDKLWTTDIGKTIMLYIEFFNWDLYKSVIIPFTEEGFRSGENPKATFVGRAILNHCNVCMNQFEDTSLHKPGNEFSPNTNEDAKKIFLTKIDLPIFLFGMQLPLLNIKFDAMPIVNNESFKNIYLDKQTGLLDLMRKRILSFRKKS